MQSVVMLSVVLFYKIQRVFVTLNFNGSGRIRTRDLRVKALCFCHQPYSSENLYVTYVLIFDKMSLTQSGKMGCQELFPNKIIPKVKIPKSYSHAHLFLLAVACNIKIFWS